jgi:nucleoid-associated protein YgaU
VPLPSIGKLDLGRENDVDSADGNVLGSGSGIIATGRAPRTHSSDDVRFEEGSSPTQPVASVAVAQEADERTTRGSAPDVGPARNSGSPRVQSNLHVVERGENFWTISQQYYYSGRYYRALWKANETKCPNIKGLRVNDVIVIPAVEDLDPEYVDPPGAQARLARGTRKDDATDLAESASPSPRAATNRSSAAGIPLRQSPRNDAELELPVADTASSRNRIGRRARQSHLADVNDIDNTDEPEVRVAARPRRTDSASGRRRHYKVRRYDTLRSIARDALGDSHRADEILDLNRDLIKDPSQLVVGQLLELPADANK